MHHQVLIAWNDDTIVVAFRGTASMKNAMHDLQARQPASYPPVSTLYTATLGRAPLESA